VEESPVVVVAGKTVNGLFVKDMRVRRSESLSVMLLFDRACLFLDRIEDPQDPC